MMKKLDRLQEFGFSTLVPVLSILQPWALQVVEGQKRVENRHAPFRVRGLVLIHASGKKGKDFYWRMEQIVAQQRDGLHVVMGAIIGAVHVVDCVRPEEVEEEHREQASGPWCLLLERPQKFARPIKVPGQAGLFRVSREIVVDQLGG